MRYLFQSNASALGRFLSLLPLVGFVAVVAWQLSAVVSRLGLN